MRSSNASASMGVVRSRKVLKVEDFDAPASVGAPTSKYSDMLLMAGYGPCQAKTQHARRTTIIRYCGIFLAVPRAMPPPCSHGRRAVRFTRDQRSSKQQASKAASKQSSKQQAAKHQAASKRSSKQQAAKPAAKQQQQQARLRGTNDNNQYQKSGIRCEADSGN